jgi:hypothetical protein
MNDNIFEDKNMDMLLVKVENAIEDCTLDPCDKTFAIMKDAIQAAVYGKPIDPRKAIAASLKAEINGNETLSKYAETMNERAKAEDAEAAAALSGKASAIAESYLLERDAIGFRLTEIARLSELSLLPDSVLSEPFQIKTLRESVAFIVRANVTDALIRFANGGGSLIDIEKKAVETIGSTWAESEGEQR